MATETRIQVTGHESEGATESGERILLHTDQGDIGCIFSCPPGAEAAVLWSGSWAGEDRISPIARQVASDLSGEGVASLILRYRKPRELPAAARDAEAGTLFLETQGIRRVALVGHSFSGAVVITAAPLCANVVAVVALASQTYGAQPAGRMTPRPLLLVHGTADQRLDVYCSEQIYSWAKQPKELVILEGASHGLWERKDDLLPMLHLWLSEKLAAPA